MKRILGVVLGCSLLLGACEEVTQAEKEREQKGVFTIIKTDLNKSREIGTKVEDNETTCRYLITPDGGITPDLVQPDTCKGLMNGKKQ